MASDLDEAELCAHLVKTGVVTREDARSVVADKFSHGQSNPTYILTVKPAGTKLVLRRKVRREQQDDSAHETERERGISRLSSCPRIRLSL